MYCKSKCYIKGVSYDIFCDTLKETWKISASRHGISPGVWGLYSRLFFFSFPGVPFWPSQASAEGPGSWVSPGSWTSAGWVVSSPTAFPMSPWLALRRRHKEKIRPQCSKTLLICPEDLAKQYTAGTKQANVKRLRIKARHPLSNNSNDDTTSTYVDTVNTPN